MRESCCTGKGIQTCTAQSSCGGNPPLLPGCPGRPCARLSIVFDNARAFNCSVSKSSLVQDPQRIAFLRSRYTSGRTALQLWGNKNNGFVAEGNCLSSRVVLCMYLCMARGLRFILEQPDTSFLPKMPRYQTFWGRFQAWRATTLLQLTPQLVLFRPASCHVGGVLGEHLHGMLRRSNGQTSSLMEQR